VRPYKRFNLIPAWNGNSLVNGVVEFVRKVRCNPISPGGIGSSNSKMFQWSLVLIVDITIVCHLE
jgi:hypothetical protein